ncbi:hypothetical protein, partial [Kitasatospora sp. NPDC092286]|uniref:hypothetical protein n=1 Tax=Kitasatospora sp. NPDC092286 TaxID=3364087 RepID=UPI003802FA96
MYEVTAGPAGPVLVDFISACGPPVPPPVFGSEDGVFGPLPNVWVVVTSLLVSPLTSFWTSFVRLPIRSYSYCRALPYFVDTCLLCDQVQVNDARGVLPFIVDGA